ncbi:hypothetical protein MGYG_09148 [Nannizzia gypsea CBS 118893]|uniref:BTB domain-containing protein n=1 Tax=Arthroderma gypseum (strain ATCC MYA-4604 / CBS 118893) TaxID=535722 RepID=E4V2V4_ARTGP|nr:hypothetical protein MGYG_09148 [Nannizzia gypsea CBS 118893]EFR04328.1 hypothetical protein MGYG_09148 [Nannizzia gypsea CBS 118893]
MPVKRYYSSSHTPPSRVAERANVIGQLDDLVDGYSSDSPSSVYDILSDSETPILTKRQRQMAPRRSTSSQTARKKRAASTSAAAQKAIPEKRQKTVEPAEPAEPVESVSEATALPTKSLNQFKSTVRFIIGPDEEEFQVHSFLLESTGLASLFEVENSTGPVRRRDIDSNTFTNFVEWLYSTYMRPGVTVDTNVEYGKVIALYCVGQKLGGGESWKVLVMKQMLELFDQAGRKVPGQLASVIYERFPKGNEMRHLWVTFNVLGEADGECTNIEFLQDLNQMQRRVIQEHKPDMEDLLQPFRKPEQANGASTPGHQLPSRNGTATQYVKRLAETQAQQQERQLQLQLQPESTPQPNRVGRTEPGSTPTPPPNISGSGSGLRSQKSREITTCEDLLRKFQTGQPRGNAP